MSNRISNVNKINVIEIDEASIIQIGDSEQVCPETLVLAVQREKTIFYEDEFEYKDYPMFHTPIPIPTIDLEIEMITFNDCPTIHVEKLDVPFIVGGSILHIGSTDQIQADSRVKNIRHLFREEPAVK